MTNAITQFKTPSTAHYLDSNRAISNATFPQVAFQDSPQYGRDVFFGKEKNKKESDSDTLTVIYTIASEPQQAEKNQTAPRKDSQRNSMDPLIQAMDGYLRCLDRWA